MNLIIGQLFALLTAACFAQNSIVYSFAGRRVGSAAVTHIRLWVALPAIMIIHLLFHGAPLPLGLPQAGYFYLGASGFVGFFMADLFIFKAFVDLGPRETLVVMTLAPIFGAIISWLMFAETLTVLQIVGILVTVGGVAWVVYEERSNPNKRSRKQALGVIFAFLGALTQATGMVLAKGGVASGVHPVSANAVRITAGLIGLILFALLRRRLIADFRSMRDLKALAATSSGALIGPVLGVILSLYALQWAPVGIVTALMQTSPILLLPIERFVFKRRVTLGAVIGTLLAIGGAALLFIAP
jgi:drug/metabolite transporter (DMT)-like permease